MDRSLTVACAALISLTASVQGGFSRPVSDHPAEGTIGAEQANAPESGIPPTATMKCTAVPYATVTGGDGAPFGIFLDVYVPNSGGPYPALIMVHGGGWIGSARTGMNTIAEEFALRGPFVVFNIDYRMPCDPEDPNLAWLDRNPSLNPRRSICSETNHIHPVPLEDVRTAMQWVVERGAEYNADVTRTGTYGESAGAHLAILAAVYDGAAPMPDVKPTRVAAGLSPPLDFEYAGEMWAGLNANNPDRVLGINWDGTTYDPATSYIPAADQCAYYDETRAAFRLPAHCAAFSPNISSLVGQSTYDDSVASYFREASPVYWVGDTGALADPPVYYREQ